MRQELKDTYSAIEEAKADVSGLFALQYLVDKGTLDKSIERAMYRTFLASAFRSIRFGLAEAHGRGIAIQLNKLLDAGAFVVQQDGTFTVNDEKIKAGVTELTGEIMTIEAEGNYAKARELLQRFAVLRPEIEEALGRLKDLPVDIEAEVRDRGGAGTDGLSARSQWIWVPTIHYPLSCQAHGLNG